LTLQPETIPSCSRRMRHGQFQPPPGRHRRTGACFSNSLEQSAEEPPRHGGGLMIHFIISNRRRRSCAAGLRIRAACFRTSRRISVCQRTMRGARNVGGSQPAAITRCMAAPPPLPQAACCLKRLAIFAMVARLQPVAACIELQDWPAAIMRPIPSLRSVSSGRPL
jgi:hypothetical protein